MTRMSTLAADFAALQVAGRELQTVCHGRAVEAGWWDSLGDNMLMSTQEFQAAIPAKLLLIHSEISEACEAHRKGLMDDKLTHRNGMEVELADAVIRIFDLAGALGFDMGGALAEKMQYNANRPDHTRAARKAAGGKSY